MVKCSLNAFVWPLISCSISRSRFTASITFIVIKKARKPAKPPDWPHHEMSLQNNCLLERANPAQSQCGVYACACDHVSYTYVQNSNLFLIDLFLQLQVFSAQVVAWVQFSVRFVIWLETEYPAYDIRQHRRRVGTTTASSWRRRTTEVRDTHRCMCTYVWAIYSNEHVSRGSKTRRACFTRASDVSRCVIRGRAIW